MKRIIFTLCLFIILATVDNAAAFYNCIDSEGNALITDNPPSGAKCTPTEGDDESSVKNPDGATKRQQSDVEVQQEGQDAKMMRQKEEIKRLKNVPRLSY